MTVATIDPTGFLPCPFCGGAPTGKVYALMAVVWCEECGADVPGATPELAMVAWNRRVSAKKAADPPPHKPPKIRNKDGSLFREWA
jgi:Lar family restriction alleviation protein